MNNHRPNPNGPPEVLPEPGWTPVEPLRLDLERLRDLLERAAAEYGVRPEEFFKLAT